jgi:sucrose-6-phosphate hydrolase SacC (GH32 family)
MDVSAYQGKAARVTSVVIEGGEEAPVLVKQAPGIIGAEGLYHEALRPQLHFSSRRGWNNDPNGLVYHDGEYHLFYQHNPYGWSWGNMHWGHAVSPDLMHWTELPEALYPDPLGPMFSGSAVIDERNTAGFQTGAEAPLVAIYTAAGDPCTQCIAYSNDRGRTFTKYEDNPVLPHIIGGNRDPKVIWYEPESKWIMALFLDGDAFALFESDDLKSWTRLCDVPIPGTSECPEFFEIAVDDDPANTRWVFYGGNGGYLVGRFDGKQFTPEEGPLRMHHGTCFYASQTFNGIPKQDGRRILIPWGTVGMPGMPFNQMMGLPVELTLHTTPEGLRLFAVPVRELAGLRRAAHSFEGVGLTEGTQALEGLSGELLHLKAEFVVGDAQEVGLAVRGVPVVYHAATGELACGDVKAPLRTHDGRIQLEIVVDRTSVEVFGNHGELYMPCGVLLDAAKLQVETVCRGGVARLESLEAWELASAWEGR